MDPAELLAGVCELCPIPAFDAVPGEGPWLEHIFWTICQRNVPAAAELLATHASRANFGAYNIPARRISEPRVYNSTVATQLVKGTWFSMARMLARHSQTQVCAAIAYILWKHPGVLVRCPGVELFLRLYVEPETAQKYAVKILTELPYPAITETFIDMCGDILCPPSAILLRAGLCDAPIVCEACVKSPGVCRLYSLKDRVAKAELFDVCVSHGLTTLALECIVETQPLVENVVRMLRNAICAAARCAVGVGLVLYRALEGLQKLRFQLDEAELLDCALDKNMLSQVGADVLIALVREMSRRPSWNPRRFMDEITKTFKQRRGRGPIADFISGHLLPFMTTLQPLASMDYPQSMRRLIQRTDADHVLARVLQHTGPLVGPAVRALFCTLDHVIITTE